MEGGVDVPNASMMVIEKAERLGLSQLHQLRGRVGRGSEASQCVLLYQSPLGETARARLETMRATTDGFAIASLDRKSTRLTPVTNAHLVCRLLLEKKNTKTTKSTTRLTLQIHITNNKTKHTIDKY